MKKIVKEHKATIVNGEAGPVIQVGEVTNNEVPDTTETLSGEVEIAKMAAEVSDFNRKKLNTARIIHGDQAGKEGYEFTIQQQYLVE